MIDDGRPMRALKGSLGHSLKRKWASFNFPENYPIATCKVKQSLRSSLPLCPNHLPFELVVDTSISSLCPLLFRGGNDMTLSPEDVLFYRKRIRMALPILTEHVGRTILLIRGHRVMLDTDLAILYGVPTKRLNEQVRRNKKRFPSDFMFQLTPEEVERLRSQIATSNVRPLRASTGT